MREVITRPQMSDMGSGCGYIKGASGCTLEEVLNFCSNNSKTWGVVSIYNKNEDIVRKFDYDTYGKNIFYHHLSGWEYELIVREALFIYRFMNKDIDIYLK